MSGPHPLSGMAASRCAGVSGARVAAHYRPHSRANSSRTMRASHAVMEPRPMIHGRKRASCRCLENPPGRSWYGWGPSWGGHSRVPFTTRREATKSLSGRGGGGGWSPSAAVSQRCARAAALFFSHGVGRHPYRRHHCSIVHVTPSLPYVHLSMYSNPTWKWFWWWPELKKIPEGRREEWLRWWQWLWAHGRLN